MQRPSRSFRIPAVVLGVSLAGTAAAVPRPLSEQPVVRHKFELRDHRFELAPTFEASVAAEFKHTLSGGIKIEYHLTDSLSIGALGFFGTGINTGLLDQIVDSLPASMPVPPEQPSPTKAQALEHANTIPIHGGVGLTFTPWFGKLGLFGKAFVSYDVYVSGGFGFAVTDNKFSGTDDAVKCDLNCDSASGAMSNDPRNDGPHNKGINPGVQFGGGFHLYISKFAALDLYLRNYMFTDNPSGFDVNADKKVDASDRRFGTHLFVGLGISFFLPHNPNVSK